MRLRSVILALGIAGVVVLLAVAATTSTGAAFTQRYVPPFAVIFCYLFACLVAIAMRLERGKFIVYNFAFIFLALGISELFFQLKASENVNYYEGTYNDNYMGEDSDLGYAILARNRVISSVKYSTSKDSIIYDVSYTIDGNGLRKTLPQDNRNAVYFFGCSFTFGEGVNDEDTLPQAFSNLTGHRSINFGVHGYGPHQMLRALETDRSRMVEQINPRLIVYTALPSSHITRAAGRAKWDRRGPRYEPINGETQYVGRFDERRTLSERILSKSRIYDAIYENFVRYVDTEDDRQRFLAILLKAQELSSRKYHAPFVVVLWDVNLGDRTNAKTNVNWITKNLTQSRIPFLQLSSYAPVLDTPDYYIPNDRHPYGKAYAVVASALHSFLLTNLLKSSSAKSRDEELVK